MKNAGIATGAAVVAPVVISVRPAAAQSTTGTTQGQEQFTLTASGDAWIRAGQEDRNAGSCDYLRVEGDGPNRTLVRFDLSTVSAPVTQALLVLTITDAPAQYGTTPVDVNAHMLTVDWVEGTEGCPGSDKSTGSGVTWRCAIDTDISNNSGDCTVDWNGGTFAAPTAAPVQLTNGSVGVGGTIQWDVTADVNSGLGAIYGWLIKNEQTGASSSSDADGHFEASSREGANPPQLVITP